MRTLVLTLAGLCIGIPALAFAHQPEAQPKPPVPDTRGAQDAPADERIGKFIHAFHRMALSVESLTSDELTRQAPAELSSRAHRLAARFESILKAHEQVPDTELHATLQEAALVNAALRQWREGGSQQEPRS